MVHMPRKTERHGLRRTRGKQTAQFPPGDKAPAPPAQKETWSLLLHCALYIHTGTETTVSPLRLTVRCREVGICQVTSGDRHPSDWEVEAARPPQPCQ